MSLIILQFEFCWPHSFCINFFRNLTLTPQRSFAFSRCSGHREVRDHGAQHVEPAGGLLLRHRGVALRRPPGGGAPWVFANVLGKSRRLSNFSERVELETFKRFGFEHVEPAGRRLHWHRGVASRWMPPYVEGVRASVSKSQPFFCQDAVKAPLDAKLNREDGVTK